MAQPGTSTGVLWKIRRRNLVNYHNGYPDAILTDRVSSPSEWKRSVWQRRKYVFSKGYHYRSVAGVEIMIDPLRKFKGLSRWSFVK